MSTLINKTLDNYDREWDTLETFTEQQEFDKEILLIPIELGYNLYTIKDRLNLWRNQKVDMNKLYQKLSKLNKELVAATTEEERERIEDEIWDIEDKLEAEESDKYEDYDEEK